jgi:multiple sugar transport system permease protein
MTARTTAPAPKARTRRNKNRQVAARFAFFSLLPALAIILIFRVFPLIWGFVLSLTDATGAQKGSFVGVANYIEAAGDPTFRDSMVNTLLLLATLPIWIMLPMLLAILIHQGVPGAKIFRAVYFLPAVLSSVIVGSIFNIVLRYDGSLNHFLLSLGVPAVDWIGSSTMALPSLLAVQLWSTFGMSVLIFLAGLSTVPQEMLEAARLDGAKLWQTWWYVVIPSLRPIIEFVAVVTTIGVLTSMFGLIYVLTAGGPGTSTTMPEFLVWLEQGKLNRPGYAAAISMVLFTIMGGLAWLQVRIMSRNVNL